MPLTGAQRAFLRARSHALRALVFIGRCGVTGTVIAAVDQALLDHELVKIKLRVGDRPARDTAITAICTGVGAECAGRIGNVAVLYRANPDRAGITLPI